MDSVTVGIGRNNVRLQKLSELLESGATLATIVHPHASVSRFAEMGAGSVVFASAVVNVDCVLGMGCIVNTGATVDRDCRLAACVHVCPGVHLASDVTVGEGSFIGIGAVVKEGSPLALTWWWARGPWCCTMCPTASPSWVCRRDKEPVFPR